VLWQRSMKRTVLGLVLVLAIAGCVPSLEPIYTEKDIVFDAALVGIWKESDSKSTWNFTKGGEKKYTLLHTDGDGRKAEFEVHLVKLKDRQFLDLLVTKLSEPEVQLNVWASASLVPAHLILQVYGIGKTLKIAAMNPDWLKEHLEKNPGAIQHRQLPDKRVVVTASTTDLQKYVLLQAEGEGLFGEPAELTREEAR
jgi:hypothetical protein